MSTIPDFAPFTYQRGIKLREIITEIGVSVPFIAKPIPGPGLPKTSIDAKDSRIHRVGALWDTGATDSLITISTAKHLGLFPIGKAKMKHANGETIVNRYLVNLYLPNNMVLPNIQVIECVDGGHFGAIIGMDVITRGDFAITNVNGETVVSFRIPSIETIDYVHQYNQSKQ